MRSVALFLAGGLATAIYFALDARRYDRSHSRFLASCDPVGLSVAELNRDLARLEKRLAERTNELELAPHRRRMDEVTRELARREALIFRHAPSPEAL